MHKQKVCVCVHVHVASLFRTEHKTSSTSKSRLKKKTKKAPPTTSTTKTQKVTKAVEVPVTSGAGPEEGEFEVESICAHQWVSPCLN